MMQIYQQQQEAILDCSQILVGPNIGVVNKECKNGNTYVRYNQVLIYQLINFTATQWLEHKTYLNIFLYLQKSYYDFVI